jgi:hypothetical protein
LDKGREKASEHGGARWVLKKLDFEVLLDKLSSGTSAGLGDLLLATALIRSLLLLAHGLGIPASIHNSRESVSETLKSPSHILMRLQKGFSIVLVGD